MKKLKPLKIRSGSLRSKNAFSFAITISCMLLFFGCNEMQNPVSEVSLTEIRSIPEASLTGVDEDPVVIDGYTITFQGSEYDESLNKTDFSYTVSRGNDGSGFNYMIFEVPECADLLGYSPDEASSLTEEGIKWTSSIGANNSRNYIISYAGEVLTGMIDATIQPTGSDGSQTKLIPGPCKGIYSVSGTVYVDENGDGSKDRGEAGIANVQVEISQDGNNTPTGSVATSSDGSYTFNVYAGDSAVDFSIDINSTNNPLLLGLEGEEPNYTPTTTLPLNVTVDGADEIAKNVGFKPEIDKIISKFESFDILLRTEAVLFWQEQFKFATKGKGTFFSKEQLIGFLKNIDNLDLTYKFDFGVSESDRLSNAVNILTIKKKSTDLEILLAELLAAKLNVASGNGAFLGSGVPDEPFNTLILKTGAAAAVALDPSTSSSLLMNSTTYETTTFTGAGSLTSSAFLLASFNGGGGTIED